ncbi:MAG: response regulator transcription factor [Anaerolineae bacterium]|nr:response regulator transcription factor [Anaerolineae bacterium]
MSKAIVLLADNDPDYRESLRLLLELEDYAVVEVDSVQTAEAALAEADPAHAGRQIDLVLADLRLTDHKNDRDFSGLLVAKAASARGIPCIVITQYDTVEATRHALRARGAAPLAEDLVPKRDGPQAVMDAIEVVLGRRPKGPIDAPPDLAIDLEQGLVYRKGDPVSLSPLQYRLLSHLYAHEGKVCETADVIQAVYGEQVPPGQASADGRLERLVFRLRVKIEDDPHQPVHLTTVHGRGYRLVC